jgi:adenosine deaminase
VKHLKDHTLKRKLDMGLMVSVNSDDPAYFGGYINENYLAVAEELNLTVLDIKKLAENSFISSFLPEKQKNNYLKSIDDFYQSFTGKL